MIKVITYSTYWFTVTNTGQSKPFHQICMCSKTMQRRFHWKVITWSWYLWRAWGWINSQNIQVTAKNIPLNNATSHNTSAEYAKKEHFRLVHPHAKALKPVRESDIQREKIQCYHKNICLNLLYELIFAFYSVIIGSMHQIFSKHKRQRTQRRHFETPFLLKPKQKTNLFN